MATVEKTVRILNRRGLHARAAAKFVKLVEHHGAAVTVLKDDMSVSGSSIMGLLMLSASQNTEIRIIAEGDTADAIMVELTRLIENRFDEE